MKTKKSLVALARSAQAKTPKQMERHLKGVANHHRIMILQLVAKEPDITVDGITARLNGNMKTISEHTRRLVAAGLVNKRYSGRSVCHRLSPYGRILNALLSTFQYS